MKNSIIFFLHFSMSFWKKSTTMKKVFFDYLFLKKYTGCIVVNLEDFMSKFWLFLGIFITIFNIFVCFKIIFFDFWKFCDGFGSFFTFLNFLTKFMFSKRLFSWSFLIFDLFDQVFFVKNLLFLNFLYYEDFLTKNITKALLKTLLNIEKKVPNHYRRTSFWKQNQRNR